MSRRRSEGLWLQSAEHSPLLPADHVLFSGAILFPGAFDQLGSPLIVFPVDGQHKLSTNLSKAEVVDFINYCLHQHNKSNKKPKGSLVSVVADLREASASSTRFIAETLLLLEVQKRTVHSVYIIQPKKKDVLRLLVKLLTPSKSQPLLFNRVLLKEVFELSNYIDRSQLTASLGGYLVYCHHSWAAFTKEMAEFDKDFVSVVQRLPPCISSLQALSRLPLPGSLPELQLFCSTNEANFQQLRRELGLDELLFHCEAVMEKLRHPDLDPSFRDMTGTVLFNYASSGMIQNYNRITAAVQKVELLWHQAFSKARLQLHTLQLREAALQITEEIESLLQQKLQPYKIHIAEDLPEAEKVASGFHSSIYTPAMCLVGSAEDVIHTFSDLLPDAPNRERWLLDLQRLKDKLHSTVHFTLQTLRAVTNYHRVYNKAHRWYRLVLSENFLQELLSELDHQRKRRSYGTLPKWRRRLAGFLKKNPPLDMEELVHLAHLSSAIPDEQVQREGRQMSQRCMALRKLIISSEPIAVTRLQAALQWQYELLRSSQSSADRPSIHQTESAQKSPEISPRPKPDTRPPNSDLLAPSPAADGKPSSLSSFDSGFEGAGSSLLEGPGISRDYGKPALIQPQIEEETASGLSDCDGFGSLGNSSRASIHLVPKVGLNSINSLNFEIKVKRSAALPSNPWLSLPVDDLENAYTLTITPKPYKDYNSHDSSGSHIKSDLHSQAEDPGGPHPAGPLHSHSSLEDSELGPMEHVLSSTVTEPKELSCTEGGPTMIWDSYDLHDQYLDATDGMSGLSLKDWDVKEQENLREVQRILERADHILTEEESVLVQEAHLDALLRTEEGAHPWEAWDNQVGQMSSSELAEAGVLGLDQDFGESQTELRSPSYDTLPTGDWSKPDLLTELREVHALDQKIQEENHKIHQLRQDKTSPNTDNQQDFKKEKEGLQNLDKNLEKTSKVRNRKDRATRVIRLSIMSRAASEEDKAICDELLSGRSTTEDNIPTRIEEKSQISLRNEVTDSEGFEASEQSHQSRLANTLDSQLSEIQAFHNTLVTSENENAISGLCVTPKSISGEGAFDPGGTTLPRPVPKPRRSSLPSPNDGLTEQVGGVLVVKGGGSTADKSAPLMDESVSSSVSYVGEEILSPCPLNVKDAILSACVLATKDESLSSSEPKAGNLIVSAAKEGIVPDKVDGILWTSDLGVENGFVSASEPAEDTILSTFESSTEDTSLPTSEHAGEAKTLSDEEDGILSTSDLAVENRIVSASQPTEGNILSNFESREDTDLSISWHAIDIRLSASVSNEEDEILSTSVLAEKNGFLSASERTEDNILSTFESRGEDTSLSTSEHVWGDKILSAEDEEDEILSTSELAENGFVSASEPAKDTILSTIEASAKDTDLSISRHAEEDINLSASVSDEEDEILSTSELAAEEGITSALSAEDGILFARRHTAEDQFSFASVSDEEEEIVSIFELRAESKIWSNRDEIGSNSEFNTKEEIVPAIEANAGDKLLSDSDPNTVDRSEFGAEDELLFTNGPTAEDRSLLAVEDKEDESEQLRLCPNVKLYTNNNNNNHLWRESETGETHTFEDVTNQLKEEEPHIDDMSIAPPADDILCVEDISHSPDLQYHSVRRGSVERSENTRMSASSIQAQININTTLPTDFGTPIVLDTGSGLMKAGFADQDLPSVTFPTIIGVPKYEEIMNGSSEKDLYVGHQAQHMRGVLALRHPIKNGIIRNWDDMEKIWQYTFDHLRVEPDEHPVMLTEAPMNPLENRQRAVEIMFECFRVPFSYVAMQAVLALYAAGRTTGVVFDSGDGVSHSVPVYDGYTLPHAVQRFPLAGADVTAHLRKLLQEQGVCMRTSAELEIVREMKERCCCVAVDYDSELREASCEEMCYTLPDGHTVILGSERIRAPEILFKPELIGRDHYGLHESIFKSILSSDIDLRRCFLENIILSGGNTLLPGLPERLQAELSRLVPNIDVSDQACVRVSSPSDRDYSVWCGGAVLANLPSFSAAWISQSEYEEYGPQIVFRKCF